jgi:glycine dehydrogenase
MYQTIGVANMEQLIYETIPNDIRLKQPLQLDAALSEYEYLTHITELGKKNKVFQFGTSTKSIGRKFKKPCLRNRF